MKKNSELRAQAANALNKNWGMAGIITLVYAILSCGTSTATQHGHEALGLITLLLIPLEYGLAILFLDLIRGTKLDFARLFDGFKDYKRIFGTLLLMKVYTLLWTLLLIVPGVIKALSYAMTPFILKDHPELSYNAAIEKSMKMMEGNKMKLFLLELSFIGWFILSLLTLCIGLLFLLPYIQTSRAAFYEDLKKNYGEG